MLALTFVLVNLSFTSIYRTRVATWFDPYGYKTEALPILRSARESRTVPDSPQTSVQVNSRCWTPVSPVLCPISSMCYLGVSFPTPPELTQLRPIQLRDGPRPNAGTNHSHPHQSLLSKTLLWENDPLRSEYPSVTWCGWSHTMFLTCVSEVGMGFEFLMASQLIPMQYQPAWLVVSHVR